MKGDDIRVFECRSRARLLNGSVRWNFGITVMEGRSASLRPDSPRSESRAARPSPRLPGRFGITAAKPGHQFGSGLCLLCGRHRLLGILSSLLGFFWRTWVPSSPLTE